MPHYIWLLAYQISKTYRRKGKYTYKGGYKTHSWKEERRKGKEEKKQANPYKKCIAVLKVTTTTSKKLTTIKTENHTG